MLFGEGHDRSDVVLSCILGAFQHRLKTQFMLRLSVRILRCAFTYICSDLGKRGGSLCIKIEEGIAVPCHAIIEMCLQGLRQTCKRISGRNAHGLRVVDEAVSIGC